MSAPSSPEPLPQGEHRPAPVMRKLGWLTIPLGEACEACSTTQERLVSWPCPVVQVEPMTTAEFDNELREFFGTT